MRIWTGIVLATGLLVLSFWNSLIQVVGSWDSPQYSHGYLIPLFAAVLLWLRREPFGEVTVQERWWGAGLLALGIAMRLAGAFIVAFTLDRVAFIPCLMGIFVLFGGLRTLRWAGLPIAFLIFMYPLPGFLVDRLLRPLQLVATQCSLFALQTLGVEAYREGNRIVLDKVQMGVVDACSGLRMLTIFLALAVAISMLMTTRPWWERLIVVVSAVPIALAVNVIRITVTGLLYSLHVKEKIAQMVFHDAAGWVMMPLALGLLYLEYQLLVRLFIDDTAQPEVPFGKAGGTPRDRR